MLIKAAPIAPMMAAALPPPGVDALLASSSRNTWMDLSFIIIFPACIDQMMYFP
jgi:hypothetical protein